MPRPQDNTDLIDALRRIADALQIRQQDAQKSESTHREEWRERRTRLEAEAENARARLHKTLFKRRRRPAERDRPLEEDADDE